MTTADGQLPRTSNLASLDALRAAAALGVVLVHAHQLFLLRGRTDLEWARAGDAGVPVFFVLSGYLIARSVLSGPRFDRGAFAIHRAARILPAYYASIVLAVTVWDPTPLLTRSGRVDLLVHILLLHSVSRGMRYSIIGVWWTLSLEWLFYLFMFAIGSVFRRRVAGAAIAAALIVIGPLWRHLAWDADPLEAIYRIQQLPGYADLFGVGMAVALVLHTPRLRALLAPPLVRVIAGVAAAAAIVVGLVIYDHHLPTYWRNTRLLVVWPAAFGAAVALLIAALAVAPGLADRVASRTGAAAFGRVSYGVFLLHPFVLGALARAWFPIDPEMPAAAFLAVGLASSTVLAVFLHLTVERPAMAWSRRRTAARA